MIVTSDEMKGSKMRNDSADLIRAIIEWSWGRPKWQQQVLRMLARREPVADDEVRALADLAQCEAGGIPMRITRLEAEDFRGGTDGQAVRILSITEPRSVNALTWNEGVSFEPCGITLVYGENGSGKSGYARILKKVTRARHSSDVLSNVFEAPAEQSAQVSVSLGSNEIDLTWPLDHPDYLSRVSFYDADCAEGYISTETEVAYRPSAIVLLDDLVRISGRVRHQLEGRRLSESEHRAELPSVPEDSRAATFLARLSADTTSLEIDLASEVPTDADERLRSLRQRINVLKSDDPKKKRHQLSQLFQDVAELRNHIEQTHKLLSKESISAVRQAQSDYVTTRKDADMASAAQFKSEPIRGVGSPTWMTLWSAARRFSSEEAYHGHEFPVIGVIGERARCVLCHQQLSDNAAARLRAFDEFVLADLERVAREAKDTFESLARVPRTYAVFNTRIELALQRVALASSAAHSELHSELQELESRRRVLIRALQDNVFEKETVFSIASLVAAKELEKEIEQQLKDLDVDDRQMQLRELRREEAEIRGRQALREARAAIDQRVAYLKKARVLEEAIRLTNTQGITRKAADLTRSHVSDVLKHHFSQETLRLELERVRLRDAGGGRGNLKHRAQLVGAVQRAPLGAVLSEGEQTALGLAGFLTEVESDSTKSAVVLDDPVSSLDHVRRERVAGRIVELATQRQVVIFTHDLAFVVDLKRAAETGSVAVAERWVTKFRSEVGRVSDGGPWDSRTVGQRIDQLTQRLAQVRRMYTEGDPMTCQEAVRSWYQDLRLVWERALEEVVLGPVLVRGRLEIRPSNLKVFARFTEADDQEFQAAFTRCGDRGSHDRSSELNRPLPSPSELEDDLELLRVWHGRVRRYAR